jgi:hypothetical protein
MKKLLLFVKKYVSRILFLTFGIFIPLFTWIFTYYMLFVFKLLTIDHWVTMPTATMILVLNIITVFLIWVTVKTAPFKYTYERAPIIGLGIILPTSGSKGIGIVVPGFFLGIQFTDNKE